MPSPILRYFRFGHLPGSLQAVSGEFYTLACSMEQMLPDGPEKSVCLRKLLEAKDAAVRAALDIQTETKTDPESASDVG